MNIIDILLSYGKFKSEEDRNLCKSEIIKLLQNYTDGNTDYLQSFQDLSLIYINLQGNDDDWINTFDEIQFQHTIKKKFDEYIFLIQDEENRLAHEEERLERRLSLECGELDIGQFEDDENQLAEATSSSIEDKIYKVKSQISKVQREIDILVNYHIKQFLEKKKVINKKREEGEFVGMSLTDLKSWRKLGIERNDEDDLQSWRNRVEVLRIEEGNLIIEKTILEKKLPTAYEDEIIQENCRYVMDELRAEVYYCLENTYELVKYEDDFRAKLYFNANTEKDRYTIYKRCSQREGKSSI